MKGKKKTTLQCGSFPAHMTLFPRGVGREDGCLDGWMDERMNGSVAFEYLLLTDWQRPTWQAETGGSGGLRLAGAERGRE